MTLTLPGFRAQSRPYVDFEKRQRKSRHKSVTPETKYWRGDSLDRHSRENGNRALYQDIPGFCKAAKLDDIRKHGHVFTLGRYVGPEAAEDDGKPFDEKMKRLAAMLREQQAEGAKVDTVIAANLKEIGYGG